MRIFLALLILSISTLNVYASLRGEYPISGRVLDLKGDPVSGGKVYFAHQELNFPFKPIATTNDLGCYNFSFYIGMNDKYKIKMDPADSGRCNSHLASIPQIRENLKFQNEESLKGLDFWCPSQGNNVWGQVIKGFDGVPVPGEKITVAWKADSIFAISQTTIIFSNEIGFYELFVDFNPSVRTFITFTTPELEPDYFSHLYDPSGPKNSGIPPHLQLDFVKPLSNYYVDFYFGATSPADWVHKEALISFLVKDCDGKINPEAKDIYFDMSMRKRDYSRYAFAEIEEIVRPSTMDYKYVYSFSPKFLGYIIEPANLSTLYKIKLIDPLDDSIDGGNFIYSENDVYIQGEGSVGWDIVNPTRFFVVDNGEVREWGKNGSGQELFLEGGHTLYFTEGKHKVSIAADLEYYDGVSTIHLVNNEPVTFWVDKTNPRFNYVKFNGTEFKRGETVFSNKGEIGIDYSLYDNFSNFTAVKPSIEHISPDGYRDLIFMEEYSSYNTNLSHTLNLPIGENTLYFHIQDLSGRTENPTPYYNVVVDKELPDAKFNPKDFYILPNSLTYESPAVILFNGENTTYIIGETENEKYGVELILEGDGFITKSKEIAWKDWQIAISKEDFVELDEDLDLELKIRDKAGNLTTIPIRILIELEDPETSLNENIPEYINKDGIEISGSIKSKIEIKEFFIQVKEGEENIIHIVEDGKLSDTIPEKATFSWEPIVQTFNIKISNLEESPPGEPYFIYLYAQTFSGRWSVYKEDGEYPKLWVDFTPPKLTVDDGLKNFATGHIRLSGMGEMGATVFILDQTGVTFGEAAVKYQLDKDTEGFSGRWQWNLPQDKDGLPEGIHTLKLSTIDKAGNIGEDLFHTIYIDYSFITIKTDDIPSYINKSVITLNGSASTKYANLENIIYYLDGDSQGVSLAPEDGYTSNNSSFTFTLEGLSEGEHLLNICVKNEAGNYAWLKSPILFYVDLTPPRNPLITGSPYVNSNAVTLSGEGESQTNLIILNSVSGKELGRTTIYSSDGSKEQGVWNIEIEGLATGDYKVHAISEDMASNRSKSSNRVSFTILFGFTHKPVITYPLHNQVITDTRRPTIKGKAYASADSVIIFDNSKQIGQTLIKMDKDYSFSWTPPEPLFNGYHNITVCLLWKGNQIGEKSDNLVFKLGVPGVIGVNTLDIHISKDSIYANTEFMITIIDFQGKPIPYAKITYESQNRETDKSGNCILQTPDIKEEAQKTTLYAYKENNNGEVYAGQKDIIVLKNDLRKVSFSPNGDGINDYLLFSQDECPVKIYNRINHPIKTVGDSDNFRWDGRTNLGRKAEIGLYFVITDNDRKVIVQLVR